MSDARPCTCPPMERPHPCARKFALGECKAATVMDPICYRWRHQKDEVWKYGHQPHHLVPPRGKELIGYYVIQSLYTAAALDAAREQGRQELQAEVERLREAAQFGLCVLEDSRENGCSDVDGGTIQDLAVAHGLLVEVPVTEPCGDDCACAEYGDFPTNCLRYSPQARALTRERAQEKP